MRGLVFCAALTILELGGVPAASAEVAAWIVDKQSSKIEFASKFTNVAFRGTFKNWDAQIAFDPTALSASKVSVSIDMGSATTGDRTRDEALPTADWFDIMTFPRARFVTTRFKDLGGGRYEATADLTLRGVTKQVVLPFTLAITGDKAAMTGTLTLRRNLFGVGSGSFAEAETVPYEVGVFVTVNARRAP